jgi:threonine aldolase
VKDFRSDNVLGCSPEILEAIERVATGSATSYGNDEVTWRLQQRCSEVFKADVEVFPVISGSAGNALAISAMTEPWGAVFCHEDAHIQRDELGGVEFFTGGAKLITIPGADGKLHPADLARSIEEIAKSRTTAVPACVSITNATEAGTVYSNAEVRALCEVARVNKLRVHMDGARLANAVISKEVRVDGVDILTLGATKNGGLAADLIVVFQRKFAEGVALRWHRSGHRVSKMRFLSAQLEAYLSNDLWLHNAARANTMAARLRDGIRNRMKIVRPVEANMVFVQLETAKYQALENEGFLFYDWPIYGPDVYRIVTGFNTTEEDVDALIASMNS